MRIDWEVVESCRIIDRQINKFVEIKKLYTLKKLLFYECLISKQVSEMILPIEM